MTDKELYCLLDWIVFRSETSIGGWFLCVKIISWVNVSVFIGMKQKKGDHPERKGKEGEWTCRMIPPGVSLWPSPAHTPPANSDAPGYTITVTLPENL
jgi:hypothetical protein